ncbi:MAG: rhomboid family intramembrane serine protease [Chlamydiales bacterium]
MRLICTIKSNETHEDPFVFSHYLISQGIDNECQKISDTTYCIWVYEEDQIEKAQALYQAYHTQPDDPRYKMIVTDQKKKRHSETKLNVSSPRRHLLSPAPYGRVSILILLTIILLFVWTQIEKGTPISPKIPGIIQAPILAPIEQQLVYDYPPYFLERDRLLSLYSPEEIANKQVPSIEARQIIQKLRHSTAWMGIYERIVTHILHPKEKLSSAVAMFVKISQGEIWRIISPIFLHFDLLHIFFNALWFILLGNQIEQRLGGWRYLLFIALTGGLSNTSQYLMSGPFFMGLSGVICGMAAFIWARQTVAPWEGYLLHRFTLIFLAIFVLAMFFLQITFFFVEILGKFEFSIGIANTAHLTGALTGYLLGRLSLFSHSRNKRPK